ncbi:MAG: hypothetical protein U5K28_07105 [Halobacteriales archaeon]|nr:hypothetical protein [Halobacteriales archaeon]
MTDPWPTVPEQRLERGGWQLADQTRERLFELPRVAVNGYTLLYEEPSVAAHLGTGDPLCFFFASRLEFEPSLPGGASRLVEPLLRNRARSAFLDDLGERGFTDIEAQTSDDFRTADGHNGQRTTVRGRCRVGERTLDATGWLAVWRADEFLVAGGGYPQLDTEREYRKELLELLRHVR